MGDHLSEKKNITSEKKKCDEIPSDFLPMATISYKEDGKVIFINQLMIQALGYESNSNAESIGELYPADFSKQLQLAINNQKSTSNNFLESEFKITSENGAVNFYLLKTSAGLREGEICFYSCLYDITSYKTNEKKLLEEQRLLNLLMQNIPDSIYFKDDKSHFIKVSDSTISKLGFSSPDEIIGKSDFDIFADEHAEKAFHDEQQILRTGIPIVSKEEKETWPDGRITWVSTTKMPYMNEKGKFIGTFGITRDITSKKIAEEKLTEFTSKLEQLNASKDKFFSIIAHDLKNPFGVILGLSDVLVSDYDKMDDDEVLELITEIRKSTNKTYNLLENLLNWARSQMGQITIFNERLSLYNLIRESIEPVEANAINKNIKLEIDVERKAIIRTDHFILKTVVRNLVSNAIKFTPRGGTVHIATKRSKDGIEIHVKDTGIGMDNYMLEQLFKLDKNSSRIGTEKESGTGLGLILCHEFIEKLGGIIKVESEVNKGSSFIIKLAPEE